MKSNTITVLIPAYNEQENIRNTILSIQRQTLQADSIVVVNDCSTDRTAEIAAECGVEVVTPPQNLGSKAKAQNYYLECCTTDLVLPVDGDTILADDYLEKLVPKFDDENISIAAGCVLTQFTDTVWERGRNMEYLFGFHWYRPVQEMAKSPTVCSGCCTVFRTEHVKQFGGFPERTMIEDVDFTWSQQVMGRRAAYVHDAVAYAAEPINAKYMGKQLWRWKSGWFQNVKLHAKDILLKKRMLALWIAVSLAEIIISPFILFMPLILSVEGVSFSRILMFWAGGELLTFFPPVLYGCKKRGIPMINAVKWYPSWYVLKFFNFYYDWKAMINELVLVPIGLSRSLSVYERGKA